ncbi:MAG: Fur family transcriptional regulator [Rubrobacteraceae bacterium]
MRLETAIGRIRGSGYKVTPQRLAVLEAVAADQHQSMGELRRRCPGVGVVTVYRTLDLFSELGVVRRIDLGEGARYEMAEDHHHHLICEDCGKVDEFELCPLDPEQMPQVGAGFEVRSHSLEVYGKCAECR